MNTALTVKELVKNAIDANSTVIEIHINNHLDLRVIDNGCGFDEETLENIGKRQVVISNANEEFRYGKDGKFILSVPKDISAIYIETIKRNSNVRLYKTINNHEAQNSVCRATREQKDAVLTEQGSSVVVENFFFQYISDPISVKREIKNEVMELALINFNIKFSIEDKSTHTMLYETDRKNSLFEKFKHFLKSNQISSKVQFGTYQKKKVKINFFICEHLISTELFQFVYLNKSIESDGKWQQFINRTCENIGKRQVVISNANEEFRYGKDGKFILSVPKDISAIYIETIKRNSNVRLYKTINNHEAQNSVCRARREQKDAVLTEQGSSVVVENFFFQYISDPISVKREIKNEVMELALINFNIKFSIEDKSTHTMLYETDRMNSLFKHFLKSNQISSKVQFGTYQKKKVKINFFICEHLIPTELFQFVYLNKSIESDGKWQQFINRTCEKKLKMNFTTKFPVYLADIRITNDLDQKLVNNSIISKCIKKCIEKF